MAAPIEQLEISIIEFYLPNIVSDHNHPEKGNKKLWKLNKKRKRKKIHLSKFSTAVSGAPDNLIVLMYSFSFVTVE